MHRRIDTPLGTLVVEAEASGITALRWPADESLAASPPDTAASQVLDLASRQLDEYFAGTRQTFDLPLRPVGTPFQLRAWDVLRGIPYGTTITYGEQARRMESPSAVRAIGGANGRNPLGIFVPCHRVVGSDGSLTGFAGGVDRKRWLLDHERTNA